MYTMYKFKTISVARGGLVMSWINIVLSDLWCFLFFYWNANFAAGQLLIRALKCAIRPSHFKLADFPRWTGTGTDKIKRCRFASYNSTDFAFNSRWLVRRGVRPEIRRFIQICIHGGRSSEKQFACFNCRTFLSRFLHYCFSFLINAPG